MPQFDWDEAKRLANIHKHGIDFCDCPTVFDDVTETLEDRRFDYNERRFITIGLLGGHPIVMAHTESDEYIRIISARKASKREARLFFERLEN